MSDPWHCGQFHEGKSSIFVNHVSGSIEEISFNDQAGLFTREIEHASSCILNHKIESDFISHGDTQSNMFWLDQWRHQMQIVCPKDLIKNSPILESKAFLNQTSELENIAIPGLNKLASRLALGCDNQTSEVHAFTMFDNLSLIHI